MKPIFLYSKYVPFGRFTYVTLLIFVIIKKVFNEKTQKWERPTPPEHVRLHETIHAWQQVCLFVLGLAVAVLTSFVLRIAGSGSPWWVWTFPILLPFVAYAAAWVVELLLPPYKTAYKDSPFEREARENQYNENFKYVPFSWVNYFRKLIIKRG